MEKSLIPKNSSETPIPTYPKKKKKKKNKKKKKKKKKPCLTINRQNTKLFPQRELIEQSNKCLAM